MNTVFESNKPFILKLGGIFAITGGIIFMIANILHPRAEDIDEYINQVNEVADSDNWVAMHLGFFVGALLIAFGLYIFGRSLTSDNAVVWSRLAEIPLVISTSLVTVLIGLDGMASKAVHDTYAEDPTDTAALSDSILIEEIDVALFSMFIIIFFGVTFLLYGLATLSDKEYPRLLGLAAIVLSMASILLGFVQAFNGLSDLVTAMLFPLAASLLNIWVIIIGVLMLRRSM